MNMPSETVNCGVVEYIAGTEKAVKLRRPGASHSQAFWVPRKMITGVVPGKGESCVLQVFRDFAEKEYLIDAE